MVKIIESKAYDSAMGVIVAYNMIIKELQELKKTEYVPNDANDELSIEDEENQVKRNTKITDILTDIMGELGKIHMIRES